MGKKDYKGTILDGRDSFDSWKLDLEDSLLSEDLMSYVTGEATPESSAEKADIFRRAFFPCPPEADISDIEGAVYPERIDMPAITEQEVERAIREASPLKAPGPDSIPNKALQLVATWIKPHLAALFNQSLILGYCPQHFRESTTVVLRKHGKDNYTVPGSYRPIGLLNTIGKIMDAISAG